MVGGGGRDRGRNRARGKNIHGLFSLKIMYRVLTPCNLFSLHSEGHLCSIDKGLVGILNISDQVPPTHNTIAYAVYRFTVCHLRASCQVPSI